MELWGQMLRILLSGPGRRGRSRCWAFSSWLPHLPLAGLSNATELVSHWTAVFKKQGIPEAQESSEYIVAHVLGAKTVKFITLQHVQELSHRRLQRMPVQYILGEWDFQGLSLKMVPPVFIPRPETEALTHHWLEALRPWKQRPYTSPSPAVASMRSPCSDRTPRAQVSASSDPDSSALQELVEWVLEEVTQRSCEVGAHGGPLILDVGCGSGAISLSLLSQLPQSRVIAVDKEEAAICLTRENAQRLWLQDRIRIVPLDVTLEGSWTHLLPWGPVDLVVSNPPYVFHRDMEQLAPEIRSYEDPVALDGGKEGMDVITHLLSLAPRLLKDSGSLFLEVDPRHPELVGNWLQSRTDLSLSLVAVRKDFCGRPRFLHIRRSEP
ncbi:MTRF1L release factor glutamine methyltransferase [Galemys pyrenaicus]|uniref:MTRF1L release factor glutamine methyltransferase n=1 Tax=Galemys pyrenaicus TaxID=202257 RepID=A0A8J6ATI2_GALPY|nr:MTRF1L release factor glutamine methyltransferase [Galemys pyrenaicus]